MMKKKEVYLGRMPSVKNFIKDYQMSWWIIGIFLLVVYGIKVFSVSLSHDTEAMIAVPDGIYDSWYTMGRFGLIFLKKVLCTYVFNPYIASFLMVLSMLLNSVLWIYLFDWIGGTQSKKPWMSWIFPSFFFTSMIVTEQSGFLLQAYEVNIALLLVGIALLCLFHVFAGNGKLVWCVPAVFCCVIAFSVYQSLVPLFTAGAALCFLVFYDRLVRERRENLTWKTCFGVIGKLVAVFLISFVVYQIVNKIVLFVLDMETTSYISDQIMWGELPAAECIYNISRHIYRAVFGKGLFYNGANLVICLGVLGYAMMRIRKKEPCYVFYVLALFYALISPFLMTVLMGNEPTARTQLLLPFVMGFLLQYLVKKIPDNGKKIVQYINKGMIALVAFIVMQQSLLSARLNYTQYVQYEEDLRVANKISDRIEQLNLGEIPEEPVVFVGARIPQKNPSCIDGNQLELIGRSFFEVSFGTEHGTWVMHNFLVTQGYPYRLPKSKAIQIADEAAKSMPSWPDVGSVDVKDGVIIVKLGNQ